MPIDLDALIPGTRNFTWREYLWLPRWAIYVYPSETQVTNIIRFFHRVQKVRDALGAPMYPTSGLRPKQYNELIGGATNSMHIHGRALDFRCRKYPVYQVKEILEPKLEELGLRMEQDTTSWIHIDDKIPAPGFSRYFRAR